MCSSDLTLSLAALAAALLIACHSTPEPDPGAGESQVVKLPGWLLRGDGLCFFEVRYCFQQFRARFHIVP